MQLNIVGWLAIIPMAVAILGGVVEAIKLKRQKKEIDSVVVTAILMFIISFIVSMCCFDGYYNWGQKSIPIAEVWMIHLIFSVIFLIFTLIVLGLGGLNLDANSNGAVVASEPWLVFTITLFIYTLIIWTRT